MESQENIERAISNVKENFPNSLVEHYRGMIIIAFDELDLEVKKHRIDIGDRFGFYTVQAGLNLKPWPKESKFDPMRFFARIGYVAVMLIPVAIVIWIFHLIFT